MSGSFPKKIGRFRILAPLGQGAMGSVFRAEQEGLGRQVALKLLAPALAEQPGFRDRFLREARAAAAILHPHVITCYDTGTDQGYYYMALELALGGDLEQRTEQGPLDESQILLWIRQCADGLQSIADAGMLHRDIKPANIFLSRGGEAKIADLGLARLASGDDMLTQAGAVMGTPAYMAPEQARGVPDLDIRADIYSLGAAMYRLLAGQPAFHADTPIATLQKLLNEPLVDPRRYHPEISDQAVAIVTKAMLKDRVERYQTPAELREDLDCVLRGLDIKHAIDPRGSKMRLMVPVPGLAANAPPKRPPTTGPHAAASARVERRQPSAPPSPAPASTPAPARSQAGPESPEQVRTTNRVRRRSEQVPSLDTPPQLSRGDVQRLLKRIHISEDGLVVWINLAPGACFPRLVLELLLREAGVCYGVDESAISAATRPAQQPRRMILAQGDAASPGIAGRSVDGTAIPAMTDNIVLRVTDDGMQAYALMRPGSLVPSVEAKRAILEKGICFGIDPAAARRLYEGPPDPSGRIVVARGRSVRAGVPSGFHLLNDTLNTTMEQLITRDLSRVRADDILAVWREGVRPVSGMDVFGQRREAPPCPDLSPEDFVGEGTEIIRGGNGELQLRATCSGLCQQQRTGAIRVVRAVEVAGDLNADSDPVVTDDLVVVRGSVGDGAQIQSASDVVIMGDLADAEIQCSGSLQVNGEIGSGEATVLAADTIEAGGIAVRRVMAGNICIRGTVRNSELLATGDITAEEVIGGSLQAGGSINVLRAGDQNGTTTELWAGHNLDYQQQNEIAVVAERKLTCERKRLVERRKAISGELENLTTRQARLLQAGGFVDKRAAVVLHDQHLRLREEHRRLHDESERKRQELSQRRQVIGELDQLADNDAAAVIISDLAHRGVVAKVANAEAQVLRSKRTKVEIRLKK
ncbi:MAG: protein kinase domain-containing protein [Planctomycetota bacterium]